jgi:hypothetical protein
MFPPATASYRQARPSPARAKEKTMSSTHHRSSASSRLALAAALIGAGLFASPDADAGNRRRHPRPAPAPIEQTEWAAPAHGGQGGGRADHVTPSAFLFAVQTRSGSLVDAVAFAWYQPSARDNLYRRNDPLGSTTSFGGQGGGDNGWWACPQGQVIIGISGRSGDYVDKLGVICGNASDPDPGSRYNTRSPMWGGDGGGAFEDVCPRGAAASSLNLRSGDYLDRIQLVCRRVR